MKVGFFGHSDILLTKLEIDKLTNLIINILNNNSFVEFFLGGYGNFDYICASILKELKHKHKNFKRTFVTPYISNTYLKNKFNLNLYDNCVYPPLENTPKKYAILNRNNWIIENCDFLIFYVTHSFGGTSKAYKHAIVKNLKYINIAN